ncbi:TraR/DksA C4-type zinc finger protein [Serratia marcescens]|nr:TraR/DksA C4-type zinc finger protein [Serratia marcescens]
MRWQAEQLAKQQHRPSLSLPVTAVRECEDCSRLIPPARLAALPQAVCCVDCQELRERKRHE